VRPPPIPIRHPLRHAFIEKLAGIIAQRVPEDVRIMRVSVTIRKPVALDNGEPGVTIRREQES
jgi:dihydroneopterin aldolase